MPNLSNRALRLTVVAVLAVALAVIFLIPSGGRKARVPRLVGDSRAVAMKKLARNDLAAEFVVSERAARRLPPRLAGHVVHQNYWIHARLPAGSVVRVTLYPRDRTRESSSPADR
jgi:beta-lactam-binding protein with PASTA domain